MDMRTAVSLLRMFARMVGRVPPGHLWWLARRMRDERPHRFAGRVRIHTFFPPYPSPAFDRFCRAVAERRRVPFSTYLAVTGRCPYRCGHCSYAGRDAAEMTTDAMLDVIRQIKELGTCTLGFTGGEPLLRRDLAAMIAAARPEMATILFTTGSGLDVGRATELAAAGLDCVTVGIESADPGRHDAVREGGTGACLPARRVPPAPPAGSFDQARAAVAACQAAGLYAAISTVATRDKLAGGELERMYQLAAEWGVGEFRILSPVATGAWAGRAGQMLTPEERNALAAFHVEHNRRGGRSISGLLRPSPPLPAVACFAYLESPEVFGCGAGYHHLFIDAGGEVCPCDLTPLSFGNVGEAPLADIWRRMGDRFARPRCACLMGRVAERIPPGAHLPLPPERSRELCEPCRPDEPLPEGHRRLLYRPKTRTSAAAETATRQHSA